MFFKLFLTHLECVSKNFLFSSKKEKLIFNY